MTEPEGAWKDSAEAKGLTASTYARQFVGGKRVPADPWSGISDEPGSPDVDRPMESMPDAVIRAGADRSGDAVVAASLDREGALEVVERRKLFSGKFFTDYTWVWDLAPDGRFLMIQRGPGSVPDRINIVLGWTSELERLVSR